MTTLSSRLTFTLYWVVTLFTPLQWVSAEQRLISFGTTLDPHTVVTEAQKLATNLADSTSPQWQSKGDQHRNYRFPDADADIAYRISVPEKWDGTTKLPLVMYLHGAGSDENSYLDMNNRQLVKLAGDHGYILLSPLGYQGAYGSYLRLTASFGNQAGADKLMAQVTEYSERNNQLSEQDVINVLEITLNEYPVDPTAMFLAGHSMGSGGTWYIGGKYPDYWSGLAPMSGPFVQKTGYPWDVVGNIPVFITEGVQTPSLEASRLLRDWMSTLGYEMKYGEVDADHGGMIPLVLPDIFAFFDNCRALRVAVSADRAAPRHCPAPDLFVSQAFPKRQPYRHLWPRETSCASVLIFDLLGRKHFSAVHSTINSKPGNNHFTIAPGRYHAQIRSSRRSDSAPFMALR